MFKQILIFLFLFFAIGCQEVVVERNVVCTYFSTGFQRIAYITTEGGVMWKPIGEQYKYYKVLEGEICTTLRRTVIQ